MATSTVPCSNPLGTVTGRFGPIAAQLAEYRPGATALVFHAPPAPAAVSSSPTIRQIELRVAALIAKEAVMISAFKTKADLHKITAAAVLGI